MLNRSPSLTRRLLAITATFARALRLLLIAALLAVALGTAPPPSRSVHAAPGSPARSLRAAPGTTVSPEGLLNPDGTLDLSTGFQGTLDLRGWQVTLDGERGPVLEPASLPHASQVTAWQALSNQGLSGPVWALAVDGSDLYVGGAFTQTGDGTTQDLGHIARYDTSTNTWHALPEQGLNSLVWALAVDGSHLYVGGWFTETGDGTTQDLGCIARYDTTDDSWHALSNDGLNGPVFALAVSGSDLYVGGWFTETGDTPPTETKLSNIARYDTSNETWYPLFNDGLSSWGNALAVDGSDLYVGGAFDKTGNGAQDLGHIARYDTTGDSWHALSKDGLNGVVKALAVFGSDLYVGGRFGKTGDTTLDLGHIGRCDTTDDSWHPLPDDGLNFWVNALAVSGSDLYVGGFFTGTGDGTTLTDLGCIARYDTDGKTWYRLPNQGLNGPVNALAVSGSDLYVGGFFSQTGDGTTQDLGYIAHGTLAVPEINVLDGATSIANGTGAVNFGATPVGTPIDKTFTVSNTGTADLTLTEPISVPTGFSVASSFGSTTVAAGNATTFTVRLDAVAAGSYSGTLQFANNDADKSPFNFTISGSALGGPEIQVLDGATGIPDGTGAVNFGATPVGTPIDKTFTVSNTGTAALTLTESISVPTGFSVASSFGSTTVAAGNATTFTVRLDAVAAGSYAGTLQFANNDADEDPFNFTISGSVGNRVLLFPVYRDWSPPVP